MSIIFLCLLNSIGAHSQLAPNLVQNQSIVIQQNQTTHIIIAVVDAEEGIYDIAAVDSNGKAIPGTEEEWEDQFFNPTTPPLPIGTPLTLNP